ncbi:DUF6243 family protein [Streptomyces sp. NPDC056716]|uniref:DUF6243 family protein n=1 Tax=unclassified Streptomyces TaxID=2593676 RepID=UPI00369C28E1
MSRNSGNMLGVGGTRSHLGRSALRGRKSGAPVGSGLDAQAQKRELLRKLKEKQQEGPADEAGEKGQGGQEGLAGQGGQEGHEGEPADS